MKSTLDYYNHKIHTPPYYQREFENDFPKEEESVTKRVALIALPFLSLYQPIGKSISVLMNGMRGVTNGVGALEAKDWGEVARRLSGIALATIALYATVFSAAMGLFITSGVDLLMNCSHMLEFFLRGEWSALHAEFLQALGSGLYLAIMVTGSLEVVLASLIVQAIVSFSQAREEWSKGRMPEALAKTVMGMVRLYQAGLQVERIQTRNRLEKLYANFVRRIREGRKIDHLYDLPIGKRMVLTDGNGKEYDLGSPLFGVGKQLVKGMNVSIKEVGEKQVLTFKVNHVFRDRLQSVIKEVEKINGKDQEDLLSLFGSHANGISMEKFGSHTLKSALMIHLKGIGTISIGDEPDIAGLYNRVQISVDRGRNLYDFHEALAFLDLEDALRQSATEDLERMKLGQLYRIFAPREATRLERTDTFFEGSVLELEGEMIRRSPEMGSLFEKYLPKMELREIYPGRLRYAVKGLADDLMARGAVGLTAALTGAHTQKEWEERVADVLRMGLLSHETREEMGLDKRGLSWGMDYVTGGSDSAFSQLVTEKNEHFDEFMYQAPIRFLFSPKVLESGTYQYHDDNFGSRKIESDWFRWGSEYSERPNVFEFVDEEMRWFNGDNEVMAKERIDPKWITGIVVRTEEMKESLVRSLLERNIQAPEIYVGQDIRNGMFRKH